MMGKLLTSPIRAAVVTAALALALALATAPAEAAANGAAGTVSTAVQGTVVGADGQPVSGAHVYFVAWPPHSILDNLQPGQRVPWLILGSTTTAADGTYSTGAALADLQSMEQSDGTVNVEVLASSTAGFAGFGFPGQLVSTSQGTILADATGGSAADTITTANLQLQPFASGSQSAPTSKSPGACYPTSVFKYSLGKQETSVGGSWSVIAGVSASMTYGNSQTSSLGIGISATGEAGTFTANGSQTSSKGSVQTFATTYDAHSVSYRTFFKYGMYYVHTCYPIATGYQAQEDGFVGGAVHEGIGAILAGYCTPYTGVGAGETLNTDSAYTFSGGVSTSGAIGINLSAQTGYDSTASIGFYNTNSGKHYLCGTNTSPGNSPWRAEWGLYPQI